jgi:hypothetical protein
MADVAAIRHHQVVTTDAGAAVDIGHILTGVDSFNFPGVAGVFATQGMEGPAAATWSGDVGSALVNWANDAPGNDNLSLPASAPLSQRLEAFYQTAPATGQNKRFHNFCRASHFNLAGNQLDPQSRARIRDQVVRFARGFNVKGSALSGIVIGQGGGIQYTSIGRIEANVGWFADHFAEWVNAGLAAEGPP